MIVMNIIEALRVYNVHSPLLRIGNPHDGGYIVNKLITQHSSRLISVGMGGDDGFERDWLSKYNTSVECYDGTYPCGHICHEFNSFVNNKLFYVQQNVGYNLNEIPLNVLVETKQYPLLKVDVEGAEYHLFDNIDLSNVSGLLLEVHDLHERKKQEKLIHMIQNTFRELLLFHIHGNVWGNTFDLSVSGTGIRGLTVPNFPHVLELSFVNKNFVEVYELQTSSYPIHELDASNHSEKADLELHWVNTL